MSKKVYSRPHDGVCVGGYVNLGVQTSVCIAATLWSVVSLLCNDAKAALHSLSKVELDTQR